jgi:hypothetical protein
VVDPRVPGERPREQVYQCPVPGCPEPTIEDRIPPRCPIHDVEMEEVY